jgi:hypothetical protein
MTQVFRTVAAGVAGIVVLTGSGAGAEQDRFRQVVNVQGRITAGPGGVHQLTFSAPVALPGVSLAPGTYQFRRLGANVLQVSSAGGHMPYAMMLTNASSRTMRLDTYEIVLGAPLADGAPPRLEAWFAPGESVGQELIYR